MIRNIILLLGLCVTLFAVSGDAVNKHSLCRWWSVHLAEQSHPLRFPGTPIGWDQYGHIYWGWYIDPEDGLSGAHIYYYGEVLGFTMPKSDRPIEVKRSLQYQNVSVNVLNCVGDDAYFGDRFIDLRWLPYTSVLDLDTCVGLEHEGQSLYVARSLNPEDRYSLGPFFFRPYDGIAFGVYYPASAKIATDFELLCQVSIKSLRS